MEVTRHLFSDKERFKRTEVDLMLLKTEDSTCFFDIIAAQDFSLLIY